MKVIETGSVYSIYDDNLKVYDKLPPKVYRLCFAKLRGFYLETTNDIDIKEDKIYGVHNEKIDKVCRTYEIFHKNLGVLLSGAKGIGKSLFAKLLAKRQVENGMPVILVDTYYDGIARYIEDIPQECVVVFDEFEKTFKNDSDFNPQDQMLSLFDGLSTGKKLFVITCNNIRELSDFLINRPGRFHYHFRFDYPDQEELVEYMADKVDSKYHDAIDDVVKFASAIPMNYDCLSAIAFELNSGIPFNEAIADLNIINFNNSSTYRVTAILDDGTKLDRSYGTKEFNFFSSNNIIKDYFEYRGDDVFYIGYDLQKAMFNDFGDGYIDSDGINFKIFDHYDDNDYWNYIKDRKVVRIEFSRVRTSNYNYNAL